MDGTGSPKDRKRLPTRRLVENRKVALGNNQSVFLSVGDEPADPVTPKEVFYSSGFKSGSMLEFQVQDFCVLFSLLLQLGLTPDEIGKSLARKETPEGGIEYGSISGMIVGELSKPPIWGDLGKDAT